MNEALSSPAFGQADLTNCERELIHLAGSVQPHGVLLVLREPDLVVAQASVNSDEMLGVAAEALLGQPVAALGGTLDNEVRRLVVDHALTEPRPIVCAIGGAKTRRDFEGAVHRHPGGGLIVELDPVIEPGRETGPQVVDDAELQTCLKEALRRISEASSIAALAEAVVESVREMIGYDRVMVYQFDPDGHGAIIAEARDPRLAESFLGLHYPSTDIPQRARELYIRNRVRVLVDVAYTPVPVAPRRFPDTGDELDMSMCYLRSMSPLHLQYLKNMGVTATLVVSLVRGGKLWGLIACHHYSPRYVRYSIRAACELLGEVISTRITAIENYVQAQVEVLLRRLEQRLMEATSTEGDWRHALFGNPRTLLQPLDATGAALFYGGEILTAGEVPSTPELRALVPWIAARAMDGLLSSSSIARANPELDTLTPVASGVLAIALSRSRPDFLVWFRREQLSTVTWAGDPAKPVLGNDPLTLSPRRSFATWSEIVRGTALPWSTAEVALARAIATTLADIILQIHAVRLLIAQHQLTQVRHTLESSKEPVVIAGAHGRILFTNEAFSRLFRRPHGHLNDLDDIAPLFSEPKVTRRILDALRADRVPWRGELALAVGAREPMPVGVRMDVVPGPDNEILGVIVILTDLTDTKKADAARQQLERALSEVRRHPDGVRVVPEADEIIGAILANASVAAMEIADAASGASVAPLLEELETSAKRATELYAKLRGGTRER
jgi:light-regulated signal transduction histidine kinase (bacteriophytochrome)